MKTFNCDYCKDKVIWAYYQGKEFLCDIVGLTNHQYILPHTCMFKELKESLGVKK